MPFYWAGKQYPSCSIIPAPQVLFSCAGGVLLPEAGGVVVLAAAG